MLGFLYNLATDKYKGAGFAAIKFFLFVLSLVYCLVVKIVILLNRAVLFRPGCRVISVGNITLGGTGKTSLVKHIAGYLSSNGHKVAILSRGYKRKAVSSGVCSGFEYMGDEAYMLSKNLSGVAVIVGADRARSARRAIKEYGADTVILDDGFQQWRLAKDLEVVAIDANNPFGNKRLLPRGLLREPLSSLGRADVFVLTKVNLCPYTQEIKDFLGKINPEAKIFDSIHKPVGFYEINRPAEPLDVNSLRSSNVTVFSGIGDPASFENLVAGLGINIGLAFRFKDHHDYTEADLERISASSKEKNIDIMVTTEKDASRLAKLRTVFPGAGILVLRIKLEVINDENGFHSRLDKLYSL